MKMKHLKRILPVISVLAVLSCPMRTAAEDRRFVFGQDSWKLTNNPRMLQTDGKYRLTPEHDAVMQQMLTHTEAKLVREKMKQPWLGACYGLSVTTLLAYYGVIEPAQLQENAACLHDLEASDPVVSMISYYQQSQNFDSTEQYYLWSAYYETEADRIGRMVASAQAGQPILIGLEGHFLDAEQVTRHAVVAFDLASGLWEWGGRQYDTKILIDDPDTPLLMPDHCLYLDSRNGNWCIPAYKLNSEDGDHVDLAVRNVEVLNGGGLFSGSKRTEPRNHFAVMHIASVKGEHTCTKTLFDGNAWQEQPPSEDLRIFYSAYGSSLLSSKLDYYAPDTQSGYCFRVQDEQPLDITMYFGNILLMAEGTAQATHFSPDGVFSVDSSGQPYTLEIVSNAEYPGTMYDLTVFGHAGHAQLSVHENGYVLESDDLSEMTVSGNGDDWQDAISFSADAQAVLLYETADHRLTAAIDTDGDGIYETPVMGSMIPGDVNGDGTLDILDVIAVNKFILGVKTLDESVMHRADWNRDDIVNGEDSLAILKALIS